MDDEFFNRVPCSSLAAESFIRVGAAGAIWGVCCGPYEANKLGLKGIDKSVHVAREVGRSGIRYGVVAILFSYTRCGIQRYRKKNDWVNGMVAGAVAGAALASRTRSRAHVIWITGLVSAICAAADYSRTN